MANFYSPNAGKEPVGVAINDIRRQFNFGERVAELAPQQSPFFSYLSKVARKPTDDPVFKFMEQRHQWQRRNFEVKATVTDVSATAIGAAVDKDISITSKYDKFGMISAGSTCNYILPGQVLAVVADDGTVYRLKVDNAAGVFTSAEEDYSTAEGNDDWSAGDKVIHHETDAGITTISAEALTAQGTAIPADLDFAAGNKGHVIGTAWAEASGAPIGWEDALYDREGYTQIFKTAINLFSGTAMATRYRGVANEYQRVWREKLMEHKMDMEQAFLFGIGSANNPETVTTGAPIRYTWGIIPYAEQYGKVYNMTYSSSGYDAFLDAMEDFFAVESGNSGNKLVLASRKIITYLNKMGSGSFLNNTVGSSQYRLDVQNIKGSFGHNVTVVNTIYGNLHFVPEPLLRGPWEDYCAMVDMSNVKYRVLAANGLNRDTTITTNIQTDETDGRRDMILTESGLEVQLPETHAIMKFTA